MRNVVYEIYDPITGKKYIGSKKNYKGEGTYFGSSLNKEMIEIVKNRSESLEIRILHDNVTSEQLLYLEYEEQKKNKVILNPEYWNLSYCGRQVSGSFHACKGRIWIYKENENKMIYPEELESYIKEGWVKGRKLENKKNRCIYKGTKSKRVSEEELPKYIQLGWTEGNLPRNTGKTSVYKGDDHKFVYKEELNDYIAKGWTKGSKKASISSKDSIWISKGISTKMVKEENLAFYLNEGWTKGRNYTNLNDTKWVVKDGISKRISKKELDSYLLDGWRAGLK